MCSATLYKSPTKKNFQKKKLLLHHSASEGDFNRKVLVEGMRECSKIRSGANSGDCAGVMKDVCLLVLRWDAD